VERDRYSLPICTWSKGQRGIGDFLARLATKMQIIGSLILGMIITILAVTLTNFYIVVFVMGIGWLSQKLESLINAPTQKKPASPRVRSIS